MIYVTGDTHGDIDFEKLVTFANENDNLTKKDYVIIAGDCGAVWNKDSLEKDLDRYSSLPFSVLFVDGNHENYSLLNAYPVTRWKGGKVHEIRKDIVHLMRGQVFNIDGLKIFTLGGATSIDKAYRREGISWWEEETPTTEDLEESLINLSKHDYFVDYIITHSCDERALWYPPLVSRNFKRGTFPENAILSNIEDLVNYTHWYFGHYHIDARLSNKKTALYYDIVCLE